MNEKETDKMKEVLDKVLEHESNESRKILRVLLGCSVFTVILLIFGLITSLIVIRQYEYIMFILVGMSIGLTISYMIKLNGEGNLLEWLSEEREE